MHQVAAFASRALIRGPHCALGTQLLPLRIPNVSEKILKFNGSLSLIPLGLWGMSHSFAEPRKLSAWLLAVWSTG